MDFYRDLFTRYGLALIDAAWFFLPALAAGLALALPPSRRLIERMPGPARLGTYAVVAAGAVVWAWHLRWLCDDAYISFRYAENLARGHGLVWNPGERVEGYTNFLWTVVIAAFIKVGVDPGQASLVLGLACYVGLIAVLARLGERLGQRSGGAPAVGIAPLLAAASYSVASFATSGLETMFAATLTMVALERADARRPMVAGLAAIAGAMAHPDHMIFYVALGGALLLSRETRRDLVRYAVPAVVVYLPYFLWRWRYYGDLLPNTAYAKSADQLYFQQGLIYVLATFVGAGVWGALPLSFLGAFRLRRHLVGRFFFIALPLFLVYVAKVGGDFMQGRLLTPALALVFLLADVGLRDLTARGRSKLALALVLPACLAALPTRIVRPGEKWRHVADERTFYLLKSFSPLVVESGFVDRVNALQKRFPVEKGLQPKMGLYCVGIIGYYTRLPIFDLFGLTSRSVAHTPIRTRGRPGHEKMATPGQVLEAGVQLNDDAVYPEPYGGLTRTDFDGAPYYLTRYQPEVVRALRGTTTFTDYAVHLDVSSLGLASDRPEEVACDAWFMESYYFAHNADPERRDRALRRMVAADPTLRGVESLLLTGDPPQAQGYRPLRRLGFDPGERWTASGDAFATWPSTGATLGQAAPFGQTGPFINTFTPERQDAATGTLKSPPFVIEGDVITLLVGGGRDLQAARVALVVDGRPVRQATGCVTELLGRRVWNVRDLHGKSAQIEIVDGGDGGWQHVLVDEIVEWAAAPTAAAPTPAGPTP